MLKHILIPTDGSPAARKAVKAGIAFAKQAGARVTGYSAVDSVPTHLFGEGYVADRKMIAEFERRAQAAANKSLAAIARQAAKALAIGIVTAALIVGSSIVMTIEGGPTLFGLPFFGLAGFVGALVAGAWLFVSILRSGGGR